eukprot:RCo038592
MGVDEEGTAVVAVGTVVVVVAVASVAAVAVMEAVAASAVVAVGEGFDRVALQSRLTCDAALRPVWPEGPADMFRLPEVTVAPLSAQSARRVRACFNCFGAAQGSRVYQDFILNSRSLFKITSKEGMMVEWNGG